MNRQISLFYTNENPNPTKTNDKNVIQATNVKFIGSEMTNYSLLFDNYDELYAITYSTSINFIPKIAEKFKKCEIIFGNSTVLNSSLEYICAFQTKIKEGLIKTISNDTSKEKLISLISNNLLSLYISRSTKSHEKIYILKNSLTNKTRVITGSANLSYIAFNGIQREQFIVFDNDIKAYNHYYELFNDFKMSCDTAFSNSELLTLKKNSQIDDILPSLLLNDKPIALTTEKDNNVSFTTDVEKLAKKYKSIIPSELNKTKFILKPENNTKIKLELKKLKTDEKEKKKIYPQLDLNYENNTAYFNDIELNLNDINSENVKNTLEFFNTFLTNFDTIAAGDIKEAKRNYFLLANWFFASPFFPYLRYNEFVNNGNLTNFPIYAVCYGSSNGGKTMFAKILSKMLTGKDIPIKNGNDFKKTEIFALKDVIHGIPIIFDEVSQAKFKEHGEELIKYDEYEIKNMNLTYPAILMTSNDIKCVKQELVKRLFSCPISISIDRIRASNNTKIIRTGISKITNDFYKQYLNKMFPIVKDMTIKIQTDENYIPDIFFESSKILQELFNTYLGYIPEYANIAKRDEDYISAKVTCQNLIRKLKTAWKLEKYNFEINEKENRLVYNAPDHNKATYLHSEIPVGLEFDPYISGSKVSLNLDAAKKLCNINFKFTLKDKLILKK